MFGNNRKISDLSESQGCNPSQLFDRGERGGFYGSVENEHDKNVAKLRRYQMEMQWDMVDEPSYDSNTTAQSNVYVIDDADEALRASVGRPTSEFRPSIASQISEISRGSELSREERVSFPLVPQEKRNYVGSKESIMMMQDIDLLSGQSENAEYIVDTSDQHRSPCSTLIPEVFDHSRDTTAEPSSVKLTPPPGATTLPSVVPPPIVPPSIPPSVFKPQRLSPISNRKTPPEEGKPRTALPPHFAMKWIVCEQTDELKGLLRDEMSHDRLENVGNVLNALLHIESTQQICTQFLFYITYSFHPRRRNLSEELSDARTQPGDSRSPRDCRHFV